MNFLEIDRVYAQYRDKPKALQWYKIVPTLGNELCQAYADVTNSYDIDSNSGAQLDVIGRVVGIGRTIVVDQTLDVCEFGAELAVATGYEQYGAGQYGASQYTSALTLTPDCEMGDEAAQMSQTSTEADSNLQDEYYRLLLKAKVARNTGRATIDEIIQTVQIIAPSAEDVKLLDGEDMSFSLEIYGNLSAVERDILIQPGVVPKPQGVQYLGFVEVLNLVEFGNEDFEMGNELSQMAGYKGV